MTNIQNIQTHLRLVRENQIQITIYKFYNVLFSTLTFTSFSHILL
jgi:hypothetical protein